jgi:hypothetical protein
VSENGPHNLIGFTVSLRGTVRSFPSEQHALAYLGITAEEVEARLKLRTPSREALVSELFELRNTAVPFVVAGVPYPTKAAAAGAAGVDPKVVTRYARKHGVPWADALTYKAARRGARGRPEKA